MQKRGGGGRGFFDRNIIEIDEINEVLYCDKCKEFGCFFGFDMWSGGVLREIRERRHMKRMVQSGMYDTPMLF